MRIVTWNVNSLKVRLERVVAWIAKNEPDVALLQETKVADAAFPKSAFTDIGYATAHHGDGRWNGVAIASRIGLEDVRSGFTSATSDLANESRLIAATCGALQVYSVYVPNGREVGSTFFQAKLGWLADFRCELDATGKADQPLVVGGDFNIAPTDDDVYDIAKFEGATHVTAAERGAFESILSFGLEDVVRSVHPDEKGPFSWWDYRAGAFHKGEGMRIDLVLASAPLSGRVKAAFVDRDARKKGEFADPPSDHAPVIVDFAFDN
ncbi:MAG: exodeoxyribonuclease III [Acidimicrobiales bacterium]